MEAVDARTQHLLREAALDAENRHIFEALRIDAIDASSLARQLLQVDGGTLTTAAASKAETASADASDDAGRPL